MTDRSRIIVLFAATAFGALLWTAAILAAPWLWAHGRRFSIVLYACFSPTCHQIPERCLWLFGHPLAVCARCFGIYAGFLGGLGLYPFLRGFRSTAPPKVRTIVLVSIPIAVDTAAQFLRLWETGPAGRFGTGFLWGLLLPFLFLPALSDLAVDIATRRRRRKT